MPSGPSHGPDNMSTACSGLAAAPQAQHPSNSVEDRRQGMQVCPGPNPGATLNTILRRTLAALAVLTALATTASAPSKTRAQDSITPPTVAALPSPDLVYVDDRAEQVAERAQRASRTTARAAADVAARAETNAAPVAAKPAKRAQQPRQNQRRPETAPSAAPVQASGSLAAVVRFALAQVGDRYVFGATGPDRWDCSALSMQAYAQIGIRLPHQSGAQMHYGRAVSRGRLRPGDLIFWGGHVAISLGGDRLVHAANPRTGVAVSTIYGSPIGYRRLVG